MKNKKGFTLIELLAVIVILAIIMVIAVPKILDLIDDSRKSAFSDSVQMIAKEAQIRSSELQLEGSSNDFTFTFENGTQTSSNILEFKGDAPNNGTIKVNSDGEVAYALISKDKKYCATKDYEGSIKIKDANSTCISGDLSANVPEDNLKPVKLSSVVKVGDYIYMKPTKTSFTTDPTYTGVWADESRDRPETTTLNPSELDLWRVIKINDDGSIDAVSKYVSGEVVYFQSTTGYLNCVGYLNQIAKEYENSKYTISSRTIGYNGQTEYITDTSKANSATAPWECDTGGDCNPVESQGGGDELYENDINLLKAINEEFASRKNATNTYSYYIAGRFYRYRSTRNWEAGPLASQSNSDGFYVSTLAIGGYQYDIENTSWSWSGIRPILTFKPDLNVVGTGTFDDYFLIID